MKKTMLNDGWMLHNQISSVMTSLFGGGDAGRPVTLPHDALLATGRSADSPSGQGMAYFRGGNFEYVRKLDVPESERDCVHALYFDGVFANATVMVNGVFVAKHFNGYTPFCVRIDEYLRFGEENEIKVQVRGAAQPSSRWYPGEGIYRDVWLLTSGAVHVAPDGLHVRTRNCDDRLAVISADCRIVNDGTRPFEGWAEIVIRDADGAQAARRTAKFYVKGGGETVVRQRVDLDAPKLWSVDDPNLYECECVIHAGGDALDSARTRFGVRVLTLDSRRGLCINGTPVKLKGGCVHHDNGVLGAVTLPDAELRRVRLLKSGGYNAIRTSHNPPSPALLDACDELGMLVMHEFADVWTDPKAEYDLSESFPQTWERDVEDVVARDFNHPSIVFWSIGNEIPETGNPISAQWGRKLAEKFRALDDTRFITNGINVMCSAAPYAQQILSSFGAGTDGGLNDVLGNVGDQMMDRFTEHPLTEAVTEESCDLLDVVGYNYAAGRYEREHEKYPYRIFVGSETYSADLDINWALVEKHPWVLGDFSWTAMDYLGEAGCGRIDTENFGFTAPYPWLLAMDGDFDLTGFRRPMSYWRQTIWGGRHGRPYIAVHRVPRYAQKKYISRWNFTDAVASWTWPGCEGMKTAVEVYSDADSAELFLNGQSLGRRKLGAEFKRCYARWEVEYQPGELKVVAYDASGAPEGESTLATAGAPKLCLTADRTALLPGSQQLCYVDIELRDGEGRLYPCSDDEVVLSVSGAAELAGSGSANPVTEESYLAPAHRLFEGRAQAVLRATDRCGDTVLTVQWKDQTAQLTLRSQA